MTIRTAIETDQKSWDARALHPLQTWAWGEFRKAMDIEVVRVNGWQLTFHRLPHTPWCVGFFPKGPLPDTHMLEELMRIGRQKRAIFIQLEPNAVTSEKTATTLKKLSIIPSHHPLFTKYTYILDLTRTESELLAAMHSKTRYNLRVAERHKVTIQEDSSPEAFASYLKLNEETTSRQGFFAHNRIYHETMWNILHKAGIAHLFTAVYNGEILTAWILFTWGETVYYPYGASSRTHREVMAPTLMLWEIVKWAKAKGYKAFDLWGALGPNPDVNDPWFGFHRFKQGFNPTLIEFVGSYDLVIRPFLYHLYTIADTLRWTVLKLTSH